MSAIPVDAQAVLDFWFGDGGIRDEWFRKDAGFDTQVRERFGALVERAVAGELLDWAQTPEGALARIVLLDQFTRNIHRDTALAFAGDTLALAAARAMLATGQDKVLPTVRRSFVYLPFEHAEDLAAQDEAVRLFSVLAAEDPRLQGNLDYARRHRDVIARFSRFPHRNQALGRESTPEEAAFLQKPGSRF